MAEKELFTHELDFTADGSLAEAVRALPAAAGVCLFVSRENQPILLLYGADLRSLVRNRLEEDDPQQKSRRIPLRPITAKIRYRRTWSHFETELLYIQAVRTLFPDRFHEFFPTLDAWFIRVNPSAEYPGFERVNHIGKDNASYWGPFSNRKSAGCFLEIVQDLFDLCRHPEILAQAPIANSCAYAQIGRCGGVCNGTISREQYQHVVRQAIEFLNQPLKNTLEEWKLQMKQWAVDRKYEQAQEVKLKVERAENLQAPAYRWVMPIHNFYILCFQTGPKLKVEGQRQLQPTVTPFLVGPGWVRQIEPFLLPDVRQGVKTLEDHLHFMLLQRADQDSSKADWHLMAWVSRFLYRHSYSKRQYDNGLYLRADEFREPDRLADKILACFTPKK